MSPPDKKPDVTEMLEELAGLPARVDPAADPCVTPRLRELLTTIAAWYVGPRSARTKIGDKSIARTDPVQARAIVDETIALVRELGIAAGKVEDPGPPHGNWSAILDDLDASLRGENLTPIRRVHAAERSKTAQAKAEKQRADSAQKDLMQSYLDGTDDSKEGSET